jgi:hypothetical protein
MTETEHRQRESFGLGPQAPKRERAALLAAQHLRARARINAAQQRGPALHLQPGLHRKRRTAARAARRCCRRTECLTRRSRPLGRAIWDALAMEAQPQRRWALQTGDVEARARAMCPRPRRAPPLSARRPPAARRAPRAWPQVAPPRTQSRSSTDATRWQRRRPAAPSIHAAAAAGAGGGRGAAQPEPLSGQRAAGRQLHGAPSRWGHGHQVVPSGRGGVHGCAREPHGGEGSSGRAWRQRQARCAAAAAAGGSAARSMSPFCSR